MDEHATPGPAIAATRALLQSDRGGLRIVAAGVDPHDLRESVATLLAGVVEASEWGDDEVAVIEFGHDISLDPTIGTLGSNRFSPTALLTAAVGRAYAGDLLAAIMDGDAQRLIRPLPLYWLPRLTQVHVYALLCANVLYWASEDSDQLHDLLDAARELARRDYR